MGVRPRKTGSQPTWCTSLTDCQRGASCGVFKSSHCICMHLSSITLGVGHRYFGQACPVNSEPDQKSPSPTSPDAYPFTLSLDLDGTTNETTIMEKASKDTPAPASTEAQLKRVLARLSAVTSTLTGLDGAIMLAQYSSPLIIALLLRLAKYRHDGGKGLRRIAEGLARGAGGMSEARTIMRAFGESSSGAAVAREALI